MWADLAHIVLVPFPILYFVEEVPRRKSSSLMTLNVSEGMPRFCFLKVTNLSIFIIYHHNHLCLLVWRLHCLAINDHRIPQHDNADSKTFFWLLQASSLRHQNFPVQRLQHLVWLRLHLLNLGYGFVQEKAESFLETVDLAESRV